MRSGEKKIMNIVIPMAGLGSRFSKAGYDLPKPLIDVNGVPMIELVVNNLTPGTPHRFIFICQKQHEEKYSIKSRLDRIAPGCLVLCIDGITEGAACTVLAAREHIENESPLMIANSDQYVDISIDDYISVIERGSLDGLIMTMESEDPKWSYVRLSEDHTVEEIKEKKVISNEATVGIYNFARGLDFCRAADSMISAREKQNGEYYVAPVYEKLIPEGYKVGIYNIGREGDGMYGLGIPRDLEFFLSSEVC